MIWLIIWTIVLVAGVIAHAIAQGACANTLSTMGGLMQDDDDDFDKEIKSIIRLTGVFLGLPMWITIAVVAAGIIGVVCSVARMIG